MNLEPKTIRKQLIVTFAVKYLPGSSKHAQDIAISLVTKLVDEHQYSIANGGQGLNPKIEETITAAIIKENNLQATTNPDYTELVEAVSLGFEQKDLPEEDENFKQPKK